MQKSNQEKFRKELHDINNQLTLIRAYLQLLKEDTKKTKASYSQKLIVAYEKLEKKLEKLNSLVFAD